MTVRLSQHKVSLLLCYVFKGWSQQAVAKKVGADRSTISLWFSRFKIRTAEIGLSEAGREFSVFSEVDSLRSLAAELHKNGLAIMDAQQGLGIIRAFLALGIPPERHKELVHVCKKHTHPGFIPAALELCHLQAKSGMSYEKTVSQAKQLATEVEDLKAQASGLSAQLWTVKKALGDKRAEFAALDAEYAKKKQDLADRERKLEEELVKKMASVNVTAQEIEIVRQLRTDLAKKGLGLDALVTLAKEFKYGK